MLCQFEQVLSNLSSFDQSTVSSSLRNLSQTQEIGETFTKFCLKAYFQTWLRFWLCFCANKNKQYICTYRRHHLPGQREQAGIKNLNDPHMFIEYSNDMNNVLEDINNYNKKRDKKVLIIFDDMIADIMRSEKFKAIVKELFIRCRKLNISIVFITQSYFRTPKDAGLNSTHYILTKIGNKKELKSLAEENSGHLDFKDFFKNI